MEPRGKENTAAQPCPASISPLHTQQRSLTLMMLMKAVSASGWRTGTISAYVSSALSCTFMAAARPP